MFKKVLLLAVMIAVMPLCFEVEAAQIQSRWDGGSGGSWGYAYNWDPDIVPDNNGANTFNVTVDGSGNIHLTQNRTVDQLTCYNTVQLLIYPLSGYRLKADQLINNGTLNFDDEFLFAGDILNYDEMYMEADAEVDGNITNYSYLEVSGGVEISGTLTNKMGGNALLPYDSDSLCIDGDLKNEPNASIALGGGLSLGRNFENAGKISLNRTMLVVDGVFNNDVSGVITGSGQIACIQPIHNKGTLLALKGDLELQSSMSIANAGVLGNAPSATLYIEAEEIVNNSIVRINVGGSFWANCNVINNPNGVIELLGGTLAMSSFTQSPDAGFIGFGAISGNVLIEENGIIKLTGPSSLFGDVEIGINATLEISDGTTLITGHTTNNGTIHMKGGRLIPQGGFTNNGNVIWEPGIYNNIADFNLDGKVNLLDLAEFADTWLWQSAL